MNRTLRLLLAISGSLVFGSALPSPAAEASAVDYVHTTVERADKIVGKLSLSDAERKTRVRDEIATFYRDLHDLQEGRDAKIKAAKEKTDLAKEARDAEIKAAREEADAKRVPLQAAFLKALAQDLSPAQIDEVKDGLTYGRAQVMVRAYQEMLPDMTDEQKEQIRAWVVEAREHAIAGFTSEEKHGWFDKYKGKIANYLSKAGYDLKKAEQETIARQKMSR